MNEHLAKRLFDAHRAALRIRAITDGRTFADYMSDEVRRLAVERLLGIVGEALGAAIRVDPTLGTRYPDLRRAVALRNRIIHGYDDINDVVIWDIVQTNLPPLIDQMESLLSSVDRE